MNKLRSHLKGKPAIFIYGFITGWFTYLFVLLLALRNMT